MNKREEFLELLDNAEAAGEEITLAEMRNLYNMAYKVRDSETTAFYESEEKRVEELKENNDFKEALEEEKRAEKLVFDLKHKYYLDSVEETREERNKQKDFWKAMIWRLDTAILRKQQKNRAEKVKREKDTAAKAKREIKSGKRSN